MRLQNLILFEVDGHHVVIGKRGDNDDLLRLDDDEINECKNNGIIYVDMAKYSKEGEVLKASSIQIFNNPVDAASFVSAGGGGRIETAIVRQDDIIEE